jgi:hypothetical protein
MMPVHVVVETAPFIAAVKAARLGPDELRRIVDRCAEHPEAGKSGGYRVITFYSGTDLPVFLLTVFGKGERSDLSKAERNALAQLTKTLVDTYRGRGS